MHPLRLDYSGHWLPWNHNDNLGDKEERNQTRVRRPKFCLDSMPIGS